MIPTKRFAGYVASFSSDTQGIIWIICSCFWFSIMGTLIRHISTDMHTMQMVFFRNFFGTLLIVPWVLQSGLSYIKPKRWDLYIGRATSGVIGMFMFFYGLSVIPLPNAISLTFSVPIITSLMAIIFLGERVGWVRWLAMVVGFLGVLVIVRPGADTFQFASVLVLLATFSWSISNILTKQLTKTEDPRSIVFIATALTTIFALPVALLVWKTPTIEQCLWLLALAWVTNQAQFCLTHSYAAADVSVVLPFDFFRLIFITILAYIFFDEIIDAWTAVGAVIIFVSSILVIKRTPKSQEKECSVSS